MVVKKLQPSSIRYSMELGYQSPVPKPSIPSQRMSWCKSAPNSLGGDSPVIHPISLQFTLSWTKHPLSRRCLLDRDSFLRLKEDSYPFIPFDLQVTSHFHKGHLYQLTHTEVFHQFFFNVESITKVKPSKNCTFHLLRIVHVNLRIPQQKLLGANFPVSKPTWYCWWTKSG